MRSLTFAALLAATLAVASPTPAAAQLPALTPLATGGWTEFSWYDGVGSTIEPTGGFFLSVLQPVRLRVVDAFTAGDAFDLFLNGVLWRSTASVATDDAAFAGDGDAAWDDLRFSRDDVLLDAGDWRIDVQVRETAAGYDYGTGYVRADLVGAVGDPSVVPEPATVTLLAGGLAGLALAANRRRTAREG